MILRTSADILALNTTNDPAQILTDQVINLA